jgi:L-arabinose isomerase
MWINGLNLLQKPWLHFHTQFNRTIPNEAIDMDYMNLHQSAHGDREHGFIGARMRIPRKIVVGYWEDADVRRKIGRWMRAAVGVQESRNLKVMRFGDNMRNVAVTEGDKVEAQIKLGWQVNTWPVGELAELIGSVTDAEADALMKEYAQKYVISTGDLDAVRYQAKEEIALKRMLDREGCTAFSNTFEDLYGMRQLPGLATQRLMEQGYGYGGEGDWKASAMTRIVKVMGEGLGGGTTFMEDYSYDLTVGKELSMGAHMLEVCPSVAAQKPRIEVHPLGIGGKEPPARLVFEGHAGKGVVACLVDMGGRLRLIVQDIECVKPTQTMPNLPVARVMWKPMPDLKTGAECWIMAGGAHHTTLSYDVTAEQLRDFARMMDIEFVHIAENTVPEEFEQNLLLSDLVWKAKEK